MSERIVTMIFNNVETSPKSTVLRVEESTVSKIMEWYGSYHAGDQYTVTVDGRNIPMDQNGEPRNPI